MKALTVKELIDDSSPYFAGTACLMSIESFLRLFAKEIPEANEEIIEIQKNLFTLEREDALLFDYSKKDQLDEEEYSKLQMVLENYNAFFADMECLLECISNRELISIIEADLSFLYKTVLSSIEDAIYKGQPTEGYMREFSTFTLRR